jgi:hypothetical protein
MKKEIQMWESEPYFYYQAPDNKPDVIAESWWELELVIDADDINGAVVYKKHSWDVGKFPTRIMALKYALHHKSEVPKGFSVVPVIKLGSSNES